MAKNYGYFNYGILKFSSQMYNFLPHIYEN